MSPRLKDAEKTRIAVAMIPEQREYSVASNLKSLCALAEKAGRAGVDLLATEECALTLFSRETVQVPGPETRALGAICRKYKMYCSLGVVLRENKILRNAHVLIDRRGQIAGIYHKMQLTNGEIRGGKVAGDTPTVFDTDFGRLGIVICYDTQFPEIARAMGTQGADLILFPHVGGAVVGDMTGRSIAYDNTIWTATVGRGCNCICDPRGNTVAANRKPGELLIVDCALGRNTLPVNPVTGIVRWRYHQWLERRPDVYGNLLGPPLVIDSDRWPLYLDNRFEPGTQEVELTITNRSHERQQAKLAIHMPAATHILTDESIGWFIDQSFGDEDWQPKPASVAIDLKAGERKRLTVQLQIPESADGYKLVRVSGTTTNGWPVLWERQLVRFPMPPRLVIPRLDATRVVQEGAVLPLDRLFMGGKAGSRSLARVGHDGQNLLIYADCRDYGPWQDKPGQSGSTQTKVPESREGLDVTLSPEKGLVFWLHLARTGEQTTQRREKGYQVAKAGPKWQAKITQEKRSWSALITIPFKSLGGKPDAETTWRLNFQRAAPLPAALDKKRSLSTVISKGHAAVTKKHRPAVEWAAWGPHYARIDTVDRMGFVTFEQETENV